MSHQHGVTGIHVSRQEDGTWHCKIGDHNYYATSRNTLIDGIRKHFFNDCLKDIRILEDVEE